MDKNENKVEFIDEEEIITLFDDQENPVDFYEVACIEFEGNFYALLQPVEQIEGIDEDEAIICRLEPQDDDTDLFLPVEDQELLDRIFNEYLKAVEEEDQEGCNCDGDCDCDHCK